MARKYPVTGRDDTIRGALFGFLVLAGIGIAGFELGAQKRRREALGLI